MEKVSTETLQSKAPNTSCCNCGKQVGQTSGSYWTKQAGRFYCPPCAKQHGLY